jgi:hypothetical protein
MRSIRCPKPPEDMPRFYQPDLGSEPDSPFVRDGNNKLVRRNYWLDMNDRSLVMVMTQGIGSHPQRVNRVAFACS